MLLRTGYVKIAPKTIIRAFPVFLILVFAAMIMSEVAYQTGLLEAETFNMFFIVRTVRRNFPFILRSKASYLSPLVY